MAVEAFNKALEIDKRTNSLTDEQRGSAQEFISTGNLKMLGKSQKADCFIATVCYDSYHAPEVIILRYLRDKVLLQNIAGKLFVKCYYPLSPSIARYLKKNTFLRLITKSLLDRIVNYLSRKMHEINKTV